MKLRHYTVTITPDDGDPHDIGVRATSATAALAQILEDAFGRGIADSVRVLDKDGRLRTLRGFKFAEEDSP